MDKPSRKTETSVWEKPAPYDQVSYHTHLLEQYKLYIEMVDRLSARRVLVNNSFITMMGAGAVAYAAAPQYFAGGFGVLFQLGITLACILLAVMWRATIAYYRDLSTAKFKVIHEIEELLPAQPFKMEWQYVMDAQRAERRKLHGGQSIMEMRMPVIAAILSAFGFLTTAYFQLPDVLTGKLPLAIIKTDAGARAR
jgi:hypothetical protein